MAYRQLTQEQRYLTYKLRKAGYHQARIAAIAGIHPSTISRELRRNVNRRGYRPKLAHRLALQRRQIPRRTPVLTTRRRV
ncbi:helix-turn-helix domain-containing protein [bacterium]|nr:helix-turn-helix domain-containing protein [bacterium]